MTTIQDNSALLGLPMELLQRITSNVTNEALLSLRLACKTLETATFEQFRAKYFEDRTCFVFLISRWCQLEKTLNNSPQLLKQVKQFCFTADILGGLEDSSIQLAPRRGLSMQEDQIKTYEDSNEISSKMLIGRGSRPTLSLMAPIMRRLQRLSRNAMYSIDMSANPQLQYEEDIRCRCLLYSAVEVRLPITKLSLSHTCLAFTVELEEHRDDMFRSNLLECTSSLTEFHFCSGSPNRHPNERLDNMFNDGRLSLVEDIIRSAKGLKGLKLDLSYCEIYRRSDVVMASMLRAVSTASLTHLSLSRTDVSEEVLLSFLLPFVQTLEDITFLAVFLDDTLI